MGLVFFLALMFFMGSIFVAAALTPILIYLIKNKAKIRYIKLKLLRTSILLIFSIVVSIGAFMMMIAIINYPL